MAGGNKNIKPSDNPKPFQKGNNANPWGRPKKLVSQIIADAKADGMEAVTASQVSDVISVLLNYSLDSVKLIAADKTLPILIQRTARRFAGASDKDWDWVLSNNLDRAHGKALQKQALDHTTNGKDINPLLLLPIEDQERIQLAISKHRETVGNE